MSYAYDCLACGFLSEKMHMERLTSNRDNSILPLMWLKQPGGLTWDLIPILKIILENTKTLIWCFLKVVTI